MQTTARSHKRWAVRFFTIWGGQAVSLLGSSLVQFALVWWLTAQTGSATVLAMATLFAMLPQVLLSPIAGTLVDRWNRRRVMMMADSLIALATLGLALLFAAGLAQVWHIYLIMLIRSAGGAFHWPAMQASTSLMVPEKHLSRIAGLNQMLQGAMGIIAPPLGALLLAVLPMQGILMIDVVTALLAVLPLVFVVIPQPERNGAVAAEKPSVLADLRAGLRYLRGWPGMMAIIVMALFINFLVNPAFSLLPILVTRHFGGAAPELAGMESALSLGMLIGGITLSVWGGFRRRIMTSLVGLAGMGIGIALIGLVPPPLFVLAVTATFVGGFMTPMVNGPVFAILQAKVAPEMQGRVFSLLNAGAAAISPLGLAIAGPLADAVGVQINFVVAGAACVLLSVIALFVPAIMQLEDNNGHAVPEPAGTVREETPVQA